mmetsp:Transcript_71285/g.170283  ORF Transcript_71285/g.170283 Transcript_71285/m.170283 type:complete len:125 (+) Transcript_71285:627-1001(+)
MACSHMQETRGQIVGQAAKARSPKNRRPTRGNKDCITLHEQGQQNLVHMNMLAKPAHLLLQFFNTRTFQKCVLVSSYDLQDNVPQLSSGVGRVIVASRKQQVMEKADVVLERLHFCAMRFGQQS